METKYVILIIYDIIDNNTRVKFAKHLKRYGVRIQKSAFEAYLNLEKYNKLLKEIPGRISSTDNVRVYRLTGQTEIQQFGVTIDYEADDIIII